jgi:hypothetical protein
VSLAQIQDNKDLDVLYIVDLIHKQNKIERIAPVNKLNVEDKVRRIEPKNK